MANGNVQFIAYTEPWPLSFAGLTVAVADGNWHFVAFTRTGGEMALYVDGILTFRFHAFAFTTMIANLYAQLDRVNIGAVVMGGDTLNFFTGDIDAVQLFDYALSPEAVTQLCKCNVER